MMMMMKGKLNFLLRIKFILITFSRSLSWVGWFENFIVVKKDILYKEIMNFSYLK